MTKTQRILIALALVILALLVIYGNYLRNQKASEEPQDLKTQLPSKLQALIPEGDEPQIISTSSEAIYWYYPQENQFYIVIIDKNDPNGVRRRTYDWFRTYGADFDTLKINFVEGEPPKKNF